MTTHPFTDIQKNKIEVSQEFISKVLRPYKPHATYLKKVFIESDPEKGPLGLLAHGEFSIPESCYIEDTGHFNAVEYNICYNQLGYVFYAHAVQHRLIPELNDYDMELFWKKQLPNWLILRISSGFRKVLNAKKFYGTWGIKSIKKIKEITYMETWCTFKDDYKGESSGEVLAGILPAHAN
ncbi:MAG: FcoT family thioesterase [Cytophagaceae bacterium]|nr:FcoT family thioesterase [Cytophagaceae bacterium]MDW8455444.1 FcoT family thioesterase [Cytophagaceae bacterium]